MHLFSTVSKADTSFFRLKFQLCHKRHICFQLCWKQTPCFQQCWKHKPLIGLLIWSVLKVDTPVFSTVSNPFFQQCSMQKHCSSICVQPCWKQMLLFSTVWKADTPVFSCLESRHNCFFNSISGSRLLSSNSSLRPLRQSLLLADTVHWVQTVSMLTLTAAVR